MIGSCMTLCLALLNSGTALADDAKIVAVILRDPQIDLIIAPGGAVPAPEAVSVTVEDSYAEVTNTQRLVDSSIPVATALLVDNSGSMQATFEQVQEALHSFVKGMDGGDVALLVPFDHEVGGVDGAWMGVSARDELHAQIDALQGDGTATHLYDALNQGVDRLISDSASYPLRTIVVLSDGADAGSPKGQSLDRARGNAMKHQVRINAVGYTPGRADSTKILADLAKDTEGTYKFASDAATIESLFHEIQTSVHELLVVTIDVEPIVAGAHELRVQLGTDPTSPVATRRLDLTERFTGKELKGNDPPDRTWTYVGMGAGGSLLIAAVIGLSIRARRRREALLSAELARQIEEAKAETRRLTAAATAVRPTRARLLTSDGVVELFGPADFGRLTVGAAAGEVDRALSHESVSGQHATIERRPDDPNALYVTDLGSSNGTYHQGLDIRGRGTIRVVHRERLQLGLVAMLVDLLET
jgi:hypothetical protein